MVYIGLPSNPQFVGPQDPQKLAEHIWNSRGPSGENKEYLFMLETALQNLGKGSGDRHVEDLAEKVRVIETTQVSRGETVVGSDRGENKAAKAVDHKLIKIGSTQEQEEVEKFH